MAASLLLKSARVRGPKIKQFDHQVWGPALCRSLSQQLSGSCCGRYDTSFAQGDGGDRHDHDDSATGGMPVAPIALSLIYGFSGLLMLCAFQQAGLL